MSAEIALCDTLRETTFFIENGDRQLFERFNLTVPRYFALKHTFDNPGISLTRLSHLLRTDKSNTTRLIRNLEDEGLIVRRRSDSDQRIVCHYLSVEGRQLFSRALAAHEAYTQDRFATLNIEIDGLLKSLMTINHKLEQDLEGEE